MRKRHTAFLFVQVPPVNISALLSDLPLPAGISGQLLPPKPELLPEAGEAQQSLMSFGSEDLPTRPEDNPNPSLRADQLIAILQQVRQD